LQSNPGNTAIIGVDLEGSYIRSGKVKSNLITLFHTARISSHASREIVLQQVTDAIRKVFSKDVGGIGIGVPSLVNIKEGIIYNVHNIPSWEEVPLKAHLENEFQVPVYINNDANCFVVGEKHFGIGREYRDIVGLIIGTGMGAGVIIDNKLRCGNSCGAGEFGKIPYLDDTYESYCSEKFFDRENRLSLEETLHLAESNTSAALETFSLLGTHIGSALLTIINAVDPGMIIMGGTMSQAFPYFQAAMWEKMNTFPYRRTLENLTITTSKDPNMSILGAAALFFNEHQEISIDLLREQQEQTRAALQESETKYFQLFNRIADPIFIYDKATHRFLGCNDAVQKVYGYRREELGRMTPFDLHPPDDYRKVEKSINIKNTNFPFTYKHVTKNGKHIDVEVIADEITYEGRPAMLSIVRDVSDRRRVERELRKSKDNLERAKRETDDIFRNVEEGIFLLNREFYIQSQYSQALESILAEKNLAHKPFMELFDKKLSGNQTGAIVEFLELLFNSDIESAVLTDLNPLHQIQLDFNSAEKGGGRKKYLDFQFKRINNGKPDIKEVMVTVIDVTQEILLAKKLEESENKTRKQLDFILMLLQVDPALMNEFIESSQSELSHMAGTLQKMKNSGIKSDLLDDMFRSAHLIKGNSSLLDLKVFTRHAHDFENHIAAIRNKKDPSADDLSRFEEYLQEFHSNFRELIGLIEKISRIHTQFRPKREYENKLLTQSLSHLVEQLGKDLGKKIKLDLSTFNPDDIPHRHKTIMKEVLIQLIRNAVSHGIEFPDKRKEIKKPQMGTICIRSSVNGEIFELELRDDGRGLNPEHLRRRALETKLEPEEKIRAWTDQQLMEIIFRSGFSTAETADLIAGRGIGMDLVKRKIEQANGSVTIQSETGKYCSFIIKLPLSNPKNN
jgi:glucokinase